jgi:hypothetical protein
MFAHVAADAGATDGAPLFLGGTAPDASGDGVPQRPGEARRPRRACPADPFSLINLSQCGPGRADREEEVRIGVAAGGLVTPVRAPGQRRESPARFLGSRRSHRSFLCCEGNPAAAGFLGWPARGQSGAEPCPSGGRRRRDRGSPSPGWRARGGRPPGTAASGGLPSPEPRRSRRGFPAGRAGPTMPSSPVGRYPHPDCTSDKAPAGDVWSGSGSGGERVHRGNSGRRVLTQKCSQGVDTPLPVSGRTVETGELPVNAPRCDRTDARHSRKGRSQVNIARTVQHGRLRLIIPALAAVASSDGGQGTTHIAARATAI